MGTNSREKGIHFIGSRELNIKRVARDRSCSVVVNLTCFNELIEYTNNTDTIFLAILDNLLMSIIYFHVMRI